MTQDKKLVMREFKVKDLREVANFLNKTGLKKPLFDILFPKDNPNLPKNWLDMRQHLQSVHEMSDEEFKEYKANCKDNLQVAINRYAGDFPDNRNGIGESIIEIVIDLLSDDRKYDATIDFIAYLYEEDREVFEAMSIKEIIAVVMSTYGDSSFLELLQPSTPTKTEEATN